MRLAWLGQEWRRILIVTFSDAVDYILNYLAKDAKESPEAKRIVINAYRAIANKRDWSYYKRFIRLNTNAAFSEGTVQYSASTNIMTLSPGPSGSITGATEANPIVITSAAHGLANAAIVAVTGVGGNTAANGVWTISVIDTNTFSLNGSVGNGAYTTGGTWVLGVSGLITNASGSPIEISSPGHGLNTGQIVTIAGVAGNTNANGTYTITVVDANNFDLNGTTTNAPYTSGGVWYVTPVWPSWILSGYFRFGLINYYLTPASLISPTEVSIDPATAPTVDYPPGSAYVLMQDAYPLPQDFRSIIGVNWQAGTYNPAYVDVEEFVQLSTLVTGPSAPYYYTIYGDRQLLGLRDIRFYPAPDLFYPVNIYYNGAGRPLQIESCIQGTVSCTAGSRIVTGSGTQFTSDMVGSVIRFWGGAKTDSDGAPIYPTGFDGLYPAIIEHVIIAVASNTSLTLDSGAEVTLSAVNYKISDPIDIAEGAMMNYFYRECEMQARRSMRSKEISQEEISGYNMALDEAKAADSVWEGTRVAMAPRFRPRLLREYPINLNG